MGREHAGRPLFELLDRIREVHVLGRTVGDLEDLLVLGDLGQGSLEPIGVSGELDRRGIREVLALAVTASWTKRAAIGATIERMIATTKKTA